MQAALSQDNDIVLLDLDANFEFADDAIAALESGIELQFELTIRVQRPRRYLWREIVFETNRRYTLERHALSQQFILTDRTGDVRRIHRSLELAIADLGRIRRLALAEAGTLGDLAELTVATRWRLLLEALPAPMIPLAYISPGWHMSSGWYTWPAAH